MKSTMFPLMVLLVLAAPGVRAAEDIYRSTMADGRVIYGESPFPGAQSVRKVPPPPISTGTIVVTPAEKSRGAPRSPRDRGPGGVVVLPQPPQGVAQPAQAGRLQSNNQELPRRAY